MENEVKLSAEEQAELDGLNSTGLTIAEQAELNALNGVKKKEVITPDSTMPVSQGSEPSVQSGEVEVLDLPQSYQSDRANYKDLVGGGKYNLLRGGKPITGTWDEATQTFIKDPLLNATPQRKKEVGFLQAVEAGVNLEAPVETQEEMFGRLGVEVDDLKKDAKEKLSNIDYITSYPSVQRLGELEKIKNSTEDAKVVADIDKQIAVLRSKKMSDKEFEGVRFDNAEGKVYQNFLPAKPSVLEEFKGDVKKLPKTDMTVGQAYDEVKDDSDYIQQVQGEIKGYGDMVNQYMIDKLPEETKAKLEAIKGTPEYDAELERELVQSKNIENVIPALTYGLDKKLDALMEVGSNLGLDDDKLIQKKLGDIREKQMFGKNMASTRAEIASSIGGMLPDIAAGGVYSPLMLASMASTMPNDFLEQSIAEQSESGLPIDVNKAKKFALTSTAAQTAMLVGAGKVGAHGLNLVGKTGLKRAGELIYEMAKRGTKDAIVFGGLGTVMQNKINKAYNLAENDEYLKQGLHMAIIGGMFALKEGVGKVKGVSKKTQNEVDYLASYLPEEYTRKQVEQLTEMGKISPTDGEETLEKLNTIRAIRNQIPTDLTVGQMDKIYPMWVERREIQAMLNGASSEFKKVLSGQVADIDKKILIEAAIPLTGEEMAERNSLMQAEGESKPMDKARLKYLNERKESAKERKEEKKEAEQKEKIADNEKDTTGSDRKNEEPAAENIAEGGKEEEYKRLVEPTKPISEMNSQELYDLAVENKKALKEQDKEFAGKTEKEKEDGGYYNAIDDVSDLRDASEKISWIESSEDANEVAKNIRSTVAKMDKNNISEYDLAIINAATLKAEEFGISQKDFIDKVVKAEFERHANVEDAEFMANSLREKIGKAKEETVLATKGLTPQEEAIKFLDDHAVQGKIDTYGIRPDFGMNSEELEIAMRHIRKGKLDGVSAKRMLDKIAEWKAQGYVDLIHLKGGTTVRLSAPYEIAEALAKMPKEEVDNVADLGYKIDESIDLDKLVEENYTNKDGSLNEEKLLADLEDAKSEMYFGDLLGLDKEDLETLKTLINEKGKTGIEKPTIEGKDIETPKGESIFEKIEEAKRSKKTQKGKLEATEEVVKEFGEQGKRALEIETNFKSLVERLKSMNDENGEPILKVKC